MPDKFVTNFEVLGEIIKVKDENLNGTVNEIIDGTIDIPYVKRSGDTMTGNLNMGGNKVTNITNPTGNTDVTNKEYVDTEIADKIAQLGTLLEYKGTKPTVADLPATGNKTGDVWYVEDVKSGYAWVDGHWEEFGPVINLEPYFKKSDIVQVTGNATDKVMSQKATTDAINAVDLTPYFEKSNVVQSTGTSIDKVMSQKATTNAINAIDLTPYMKKDGSTTMTGDLNVGNNKITNLKSGTTSTDGIRYDQVFPALTNIIDNAFVKAGTVAMTGNLNVGTNKIINLGAPVDNTDATTKQYVDNKVDSVPTYNLPQADNDNLGGIKAAPADSSDTQDVHITTDGHLKTKPGSGGTGNGDFMANGSVPMTGELEMNGNSIDFTPVDGSSNHLAALTYNTSTKNLSLERNVLPSGGSSINLLNDKITHTVNSSNVMTLENNKIKLNGGQIKNVGTPTEAADATTKSYVDTHGVPEGGSAGQILTKIDNLSFNTRWADYRQASDTLIGGIKAAPVTSDDTQDVHITSDGHLKTKPGSGGGTGGGLSPITVTRDEAYISTPENNNTTKVLADPTAPTDKPIQAGQIAVYSTTNQTYNTEDVGATLLVADPHSDMEAVNKRTNDTKLAKANINDNFKRVTAVQGSNPGTESYHILTKTFDDVAEDRIPMYGANSNINVRQITGAIQQNVQNMIDLSTGNKIIFFVSQNRVNFPALNILTLEGSFTGGAKINANNNKIANVKTPIDNNDATNKQYVDTHIAGLDLPTPDADGNYVLHYTKSSNSWSIIPLTTGGPSIG